MADRGLVLGDADTEPVTISRAKNAQRPCRRLCACEREPAPGTDQRRELAERLVERVVVAQIEGPVELRRRRAVAPNPRDCSRPRSLHVVLDDASAAALEVVRAGEMTDSEVVRTALREAAARRRVRSASAGGAAPGGR